MPIQKDIFIDNYLQALNNGDAAIFAGAGLSVPSGCVNWKQLLNVFRSVEQPKTIRNIQT